MKKTLCLFLVIALITVCCSCGSVTDTSTAVQSDSFVVAESGTSEQAEQAAKDPIVAEEVEPGATTSEEDPAQAVVTLPLTETPEKIPIGLN